MQAEFYQFVVAATYHADGLWGDATFDLYARGLPEDHGYLVAAGLDPLLEQLTALRFSDADIERLRADPHLGRASPAFFEMLRRFRFQGEVWAVPEGTPVFPGEPLLRVTAPIVACTLLETRAIQLVGTATACATRAARLVEAAGGRDVLDFGSRRCPGPEAALAVARAAYIGGVSATSNALASATLGLPAMGTMSDTFLAVYGDDRLAHEAFRANFPALCHFTLPDDAPVEGVRSLARLARSVHTVRIDHPDLAGVARAVRAELDRNGMRHVRILGSGHLDEHSVSRMVSDRAPVDLFAVGRALAAPGDAGIRLAFRIAERLTGPTPEPVVHPGAAGQPGRKQVLRQSDHDILCLEHERGLLAAGTAVELLRPVLQGGQRVAPQPTLAESRELRARAVSSLPASVRALRAPAAWPVRVSPGLAALRR